MSVFHTESFEVAAPPERVATFILDPDRVREYFPDALDGGRFSEGDAIWIRGKTGVTMIERLSDPNQQACVRVRVTSTQLTSEAPDRAELAAAPLLRFCEDWELAAEGEGTRVSKSWRDLEKFGLMRLLPAGWLVRRTARSGVPVLVEAWSRA